MSNIDILTREGGALASLDRSVINNVIFRSFVNNIQLRKFDDGSFVNMLLELSSSVLTSSNFTGGILNLHTKDDDIITNSRFSSAILVMNDKFLRSSEFRQFVNRLDPSLLERRDDQFSFSGQLRAEYIDALVRSFGDRELQNKNLNDFVNDIDVGLFLDGSFSNFITSTETSVITNNNFTDGVAELDPLALTNGRFTDYFSSLDKSLLLDNEFISALGNIDAELLRKESVQGLLSSVDSDVVKDRTFQKLLNTLDADLLSDGSFTSFLTSVGSDVVKSENFFRAITGIEPQVVGTKSFTDGLSLLDKSALKSEAFLDTVVNLKNRGISEEASLFYLSVFDGPDNGNSLANGNIETVVAQSPLTEEDERGFIQPEFITGGSIDGETLSSVEDVNQRRIGLRLEKEPVDGNGNRVEADQTWVIIHGLNDDPDSPNMRALAEAISTNAATDDRVLFLDWREASNNNAVIGFPPGNNIAGTWIASTARYLVTALKEEYQIDSITARNRLNLVGHSLGTYVSAEAGRLYRDGFEEGGISRNGSSVEGTGGVRTITALDPAADTTLPGEVYDLDETKDGRQAPERFDRVSLFSRSFNGALSVAGNQEQAITADESYRLDFGTGRDFLADVLLPTPISIVRGLVPATSASIEEHGRVVQTFANLAGREDLMGRLLGIGAYDFTGGGGTLPVDDFEAFEPTFEVEVNLDRLDDEGLPLVEFSTGSKVGFNGVIQVSEDDQAQLLVAEDRSSEVGRIIIGDDSGNIIEASSDNNKIFGEGEIDILSGGGGNDTLVGGDGDDLLFGFRERGGFAGASDDDLLYGGIGTDRLDGGSGADVFAYRSTDFSNTAEEADIITNFSNDDRIGLVDLSTSLVPTYENIIVEGLDSTAVILSGKYVARLKDVLRSDVQDLDILSSVSSSELSVG